MRNPWGKNGYNGKFTEDCEFFDDEDMRKRVDYSDLDKDDGLFLMSWKEWVSTFSVANCIVTPNRQKYHHSGHIIADFNEITMPCAFYEFTLKSSINCDKDSFTINCY